MSNEIIQVEYSGETVTVPDTIHRLQLFEQQEGELTKVPPTIELDRIFGYEDDIHFESRIDDETWLEGIYDKGRWVVITHPVSDSKDGELGETLWSRQG